MCFLWALLSSQLWNNVDISDLPFKNHVYVMHYPLVNYEFEASGASSHFGDCEVFLLRKSMSWLLSPATWIAIESMYLGMHQSHRRHER